MSDFYIKDDGTIVRTNYPGNTPPPPPPPRPPQRRGSNGWIWGVVIVIAVIIGGVWLFDEISHNQSPTTPWDIPRERRARVLAESGLIIRARPNVNSDRLASASFNQSVVILQERYRADNVAGSRGYWTRVRYGNVVGFAWGNFLDIESNQMRTVQAQPRPQPTQQAATIAPTADIRSVRVEHNVYQNNLRGMRIYVTFGVQNMQGRTGNSAVWFSFNDGRQVMGYSSQHRTTTGQATVQRRITPTYPNSVWTDLAFFMPYSELSTPSGRHYLRFRVGIIDDNGNQIATSGFTNFQLTR